MAAMEVNTQIFIRRPCLREHSRFVASNSKSMLSPASQPGTEYGQGVKCESQPIPAQWKESSKTQLCSRNSSSWLKLSQNCGTIWDPTYPVLHSLCSFTEVKPTLQSEGSPYLQLISSSLSSQALPPIKFLSVLSHLGCFLEDPNWYSSLPAMIHKIIGYFSLKW